MKTIPHSRPKIGAREAIAAAREIMAGHLAAGPKIGELENSVSDYTGRLYARSTSSGTTAIQLALRAMGIGTGDSVIMPSYCCYSVYSAIDNAGAIPVLADVDAIVPNLSAETVKKNLTKRTKAVIVPHMYGSLADIECIESLGIPVIEDCAQAFGAVSWEGRAGSRGVVSILSFYATKMMAGAKGGMILTDTLEISKRLEDLMRYDCRDTGGECYNLSMTNIEAAIALEQLKRLDGFADKRFKLAEAYDNLLREKGLESIVMPRPLGSVPFRYVVRLPERLEIDEVMKSLDEEGVDVRTPVFRPLHTYFGMEGNLFPNTESAQRHNLSLPIYPRLSFGSVSKVVDHLADHIKGGL